MQAYDMDEKDKGLFTFYREQAELQDKITKMKNQRFPKLKQLSSQNEFANNSEQISQKSSLKTQQRGKKQRPQEEKQSQKSQVRGGDTEKKHKQFQKKLLQILQKHKYDRQKRRNLKVIMKLRGQDQIALKYHLQALMHQQNQLSLQSAKQKSEVFSQKRDPMDTFERVALLQTKFEVEMDDMSEVNRRKNVKIKKIGNFSNSNAMSLEKPIQQIRGKALKGEDYSQMTYRQLLPKIQFKTNNASNKSVQLGKLKQDNLSSRQPIKTLVGSGQLQKLSKIKSSKDKSLCLESSRYANQLGRMRQNFNNKIYPIFIENIENKQSKKNEQDAKIDKEKMFSQLIRKLKFT